MPPVLLLGGLAFGILIQFFGGLGVLVYWIARGRERPLGSLSPTAASEPPEPLPPALAALLLNLRVLPSSVIATLADLGQRGFVLMISGAGGPRFRLLRTVDGLRDFERILIEAAFGKRPGAAGTGKEATAADLRHGLQPRWRAFVLALEMDIFHQQYLLFNVEERQRVWRRRGLAGMLACGLVAMACVLVLPDEWKMAAGYPALALLLVFAEIRLLGSHLAHRTKRGNAAATRWQAFRRHLELIPRFYGGSRAAEQYDRFLPYAIAFGLTKAWEPALAKHHIVPAWFRRETAAMDPSTALSSALDSALAAVSASTTASVADGGNQAGKIGKAQDSGECSSVDSLNDLSAGVLSAVDSTAGESGVAAEGSSGSGGIGESGRTDSGSPVDSGASLDSGGSSGSD